MSRFTLPRDIYHGSGSLEELKKLKGKKAILVVGGGSMRRQGFLDKAVGYLNSLNASTGLEAAWIKKAKTSLKTTAIRRAMIDSYNIATEAVRKYYHSAMTIAQKFVDADKEYNRLAENKNGEKKGKGLKAYDKKYNIKEA